MLPQSHSFVSRRTGDGHAWTIELGGEIDLYNSTTVKREFDRILASAPTPQALFVDLNQITFMDSMGIGLLIAAHRRAAEVGCQFTITSMSAVIERVLVISGLADRLTDGAT
jgi:anti-sigma B factor antagonist